VSEPSAFDARKLFLTLAQHGVQYVTIGGIAIQAHGGQRLTQDLDIAIDTSIENLQRLADALADLDARILSPDGQRSRSTPSAQLLAGCAARSATSYLYRVSTSQMRSVPHSISPAGTRSSAA